MQQGRKCKKQSKNVKWEHNTIMWLSQYSLHPREGAAPLWNRINEIKQRTPLVLLPLVQEELSTRTQVSHSVISLFPYVPSVSSHMFLTKISVPLTMIIVSYPYTDPVTSIYRLQITKTQQHKPNRKHSIVWCVSN